MYKLFNIMQFFNRFESDNQKKRIFQITLRFCTCISTFCCSISSACFSTTTFSSSTSWHYIILRICVVIHRGSDKRGMVCLSNFNFKCGIDTPQQPIPHAIVFNHPFWLGLVLSKPQRTRNSFKSQIIRGREVQGPIS